jgi:hypothetical protein
MSGNGLLLGPCALDQCKRADGRGQETKIVKQAELVLAAFENSRVKRENQKPFTAGVYKLRRHLMKAINNRFGGSADQDVARASDDESPLLLGRLLDELADTYSHFVDKFEAAKVEIPRQPFARAAAGQFREQFHQEILGELPDPAPAFVG